VVDNHLCLSFLIVGDRCNIAGSIVFKKLTMAGKYANAMDIVRVGRWWTARMLDGLAAMQKFVKIAVTEPEIAKVPFMLDASKFEIVLGSEVVPGQAHREQHFAQGGRDAAVGARRDDCADNFRRAGP
jgi:cobalamin-dependent methionine synthase I